jgi:hypothetical protein
MRSASEHNADPLIASLPNHPRSIPSTSLGRFEQSVTYDTAACPKLSFAAFARLSTGNRTGASGPEAAPLAGTSPVGDSDNEVEFVVDGDTSRTAAPYIAAIEGAKKQSKGDSEEDNMSIASYIVPISDDEIPELPSSPPAMSRQGQPH